MSVVRCILLCDDSNLILASRAVQFLLKNPDRRDAFLLYGEGEGRGSEVEMFAKRLKKSIRVQQVKP